MHTARRVSGRRSGRWAVWARFSCATLTRGERCVNRTPSAATVLVWGIGLRRLGCGPGGGARRLVMVTLVCVIRETTQTGCPWSRPRVSLT
eukprot:scaffold45999_cov63-Phaeocystis_antarctica.AAC.1